LSNIFFEVRMRYKNGIKTTIMCSTHAARCSKFPKQFLDFKMTQDPDAHCKWCDKDSAAKSRIIQWASDSGIDKVVDANGVEIPVEDWVDLMIATAGDL